MLKNILFIIFGTVILAFGTALFIIPFDLVVGGVSGVAIIINRLIGIKYITVDLLITVITWTLFFVGLFTLGKSFAIKTLISTFVYTVGVSLFSKLTDPRVLGGFFCLSQSRYASVAIILATLFGGALIGTGCAITFLGGGSTGGMDILSFTICKIFKKLRSSMVIFCIDAAIIILGMFAIRDLVVSLLGIISALLCALVIDKIFLGESTAFIAQIISDKCDDINRKIIKKLERTTTLIDAVGGYSKKSKKMLMISFTIAQYAELMTIVTQIDKDAFVAIHRAHEINGEGWTR